MNAPKVRNLTPCGPHGLALSDCEACTRYDGECDLDPCAPIHRP